MSLPLNTNIVSMKSDFKSDSTRQGGYIQGYNIKKHY